MTAPTATAEVVRMLVGGRWETSHSPRGGEVCNPSTGRVIARVPFCTAGEVDRAVEAAAAALPAWAQTPVVERARVMFRFRELLPRHAEELAHCGTREHGKTLAESRASVQRGVEMFYTRQKTTRTRWFRSPGESHHDPVWRTGPGGT